VGTAEIDPEVTRAAQEALALEGLAVGERVDADLVAQPLWAVHDDARAVVRALARLPEGARPSFDFVYMDAFGDLGVPWHLTTIEFLREVKQVLAPGGTYFANSIDVWDSGRFVAALWTTLRAAFRHVALVGARRGDDWVQNFVFVASDAPVDLAGLLRRNPAGASGAARVPVIRYADEEVDALCARVRARALTDDFAPVEDLLAPAVEITSRR
jgi:hypothetical protein